MSFMRSRRLKNFGNGLVPFLLGMPEGSDAVVIGQVEVCPRSRQQSDDFLLCRTTIAEHDGFQ